MIIEILSLYGISATLLSLLSLYRAIALSHIFIFSISPIMAYLLSKITSKNKIRTIAFPIIFLLSAIALLLFDKEPFLFKRMLSIPILLILDTLAANKSKKSSLIRLFDVSLIVAILVFSYNRFYKTESLAITMLSSSGPIALLYALYLKRANLGRNARITSLIIISALTTLVIGFSKFETFIEAGAFSIAKAFSHIFISIYIFFVWLFSFIPHINWALNNDIIPNGVDAKYNQHDVFSAPLNTSVLKVIALCILSIAALCLLVHISRKARFKKHEKEHKVLKTSSAAPSLLKAIKRAINELKKSLKALIFIHKNMTNSIGLTLWLQRKLRHSIREKKDNESYSSFLRRLYSEYEEEELLEAADDISKRLYSKDHQPPLTITSLHSIKAKTYQLRFSEIRSKLKQRSALKRT